MMGDVTPTDRDDTATEAARILAQAHAEAEAIRREALVTADGIRRIALEDARSLDLSAVAPAVARQPSGAELVARLERLERRQRKLSRRIERLEDVLLGLAPGLSRRKKR